MWKIRALLLLVLFASFAASAEAGSLTLAWDANSESDIAGYVVNYGIASGSYSNSLDAGNVTSVTIASLTDGQQYFFAVRAYNTSGLQSPLSNEISGTPVAATGCTYTLSSTSASVSASASTGTVSITASAASCSSTAASTASWITVTAGATGTGSRTVSYSVAANTTTSSRTGTMTVAGQTLTVTQAASTPTRIIALSGSLAFGNVSVGTTATQTLTISNTGNSALTVSAIAYPAGLSGNWSSGTVAAGGSQAVTVTFAPTTAASYGGTVTVTANQTSGTSTIAASGSGAAATRIIALSGSLAFGNVSVGTTATQTLTIGNTGNSALTVSAIAYPAGFSGNWSSGTVAAGGSQAVTVTFAPPAAASYGGTVTVTANQTSGTSTIAASGAGIAVSKANGPPNPTLVFDAPANGSATDPSFTVSGWAIDRGAGSGTGIDAVQVYIYPNGSSTSAFAAAATYATARPDIGAAFGTEFTNSGFSAAVSGLVAGTYQIMAFGHSTVTNSFSVAATVTVTVTVPVSRPVISLDGPQKNSTVGRTVTIAGWAIDQAVSSGTGVDAVHVWAYPSDGSPGQFLGAASYGVARPDIGAAVGSQFANSGFRLSAVVQLPGTYRIVAFAHSTLANAFNTAVAADNVTVQSSNTNALLFVDTPAHGSTKTRPFTVSGWAVDSGAASGTGIDFIDMWAFTLNGAGIYLGADTYGTSRPDIGSLFGDSRFTSSGFTFTVTSANLAAGTYDLVAFGRSTVTNAFTVARVVRVTVQ